MVSNFSWEAAKVAIVISLLTLPLIGKSQSRSKNRRIIKNAISQSYQDEYSRLSDFDINNSPIGYWDIYDSGRNRHIGFIITGHAEKEICEVASREVELKIDAIGRNNSSVFTFGVGYDYRPDDKAGWTYQYHQQLSQLKKKFSQLAFNYPDQVVVHRVNHLDYQDALREIEKNLSIDKETSEPRCAQEIYGPKFPIVVPFYSLKDGKPVRFSISKTSIDKDPGEMVYGALVGKINSYEKKVTAYLDHNLNELERLSGDSAQNIEIYSYFYVEDDKIFEKEIILEKLPEVPNDYYVETIDQNTGAVIEVVTPSAEELKTYYENPNHPIWRNSSVNRYSLGLWLERYESSHSGNMEIIGEGLKSIQQGVNSLKAELDRVTEIKTNIRNRSGEMGYWIDAFLRGWAFNTHTASLNRELDKWYRARRESVWIKIFTDLGIPPGSGIRIGGIFHYDDVFFRVTSNRNGFEVTPLKVLGGNYLLIQDEELGIAQYVTTLNHRYE